jgi:hypothetical protein
MAALMAQPQQQQQSPSERPTANATATIEPLGAPTTVPRSHSIALTIRLGVVDPKHPDDGSLAIIARKSLEAALPPRDASHHPETSVVEISNMLSRTKVVVGVEGSLVWPGRPDSESVDRLRAVLSAARYSVTLRERRECSEAACSSDALVEWNHPSEQPAGWYNNRVCGKHSYRACGKCDSLYVMSSISSVGQAPSVHCAVCGEIMVEWGSSKTWSAELLTRGKAHG